MRLQEQRRLTKSDCHLTKVIHHKVGADDVVSASRCRPAAGYVDHQAANPAPPNGPRAEDGTE